MSLSGHSYEVPTPTTASPNPWEAPVLVLVFAERLLVRGTELWRLASYLTLPSAGLGSPLLQGKPSPAGLYIPISGRIKATLAAGERLCFSIVEGPELCEIQRTH